MDDDREQDARDHRPHDEVALAGREHAGLDGDREVGEITSGALSPTLGYPIAMAYVTPEVAEPGTTLSVDIRGRTASVEVVSLPFYQRTKG